MPVGCGREARRTRAVRMDTLDGARCRACGRIALMPDEEVTRRSESGFAHVMIVVVVAVLVVLGYFALADAMKPSHRSTAQSRAPKASSNGPRIDARALADTVGPAVVEIDATLAGGVHSHASGMLLTSAGEVLTNNHAIAGATTIAVKAANGSTYAATVRGYDVRDDVAVLGLVDAAALPAISPGDSATVSVGEPALALGRVPGTNAIAPQAGSVTALGRPIEAGDANDPSGIEALRDMVQIDAPTRPSDSGGPVIDTHGKVIAMTTAASNGRVFHEQSAGTTFAIPIDTVVQVADRVDAGVSTATVHVGSTATLGVAVAPVSKTPTANARVVRVQPGGPAARAGLVPNTVIVSIDDVTIATAADLDAALNGRRPGAVVHVDWADTTGGFHTSAVRLASGPPA
jgi:S1-C subfamily serine protease